MNPIHNFPAKLKELNQWAIAGKDKSPLVIREGMLTRVSVTDTGSLMSFNDAVAHAELNNLGVGFVLCESDPYTCVDLDIKDFSSRDKRGHVMSKDKWTTQEEINRYESIIDTFDSYTELSQSGKGVHIWTEGAIGQGRRRGGVEVYSKERFIICTGCYVNKILWRMENNFWKPENTIGKVPKPITNGQMLLNNMVMQLGVVRDIRPLDELPEERSDDEVLEIARSATNSEKFNQLYIEGDWAAAGYPSQSEADLSLMSMFTFYSPSNEQCRRLFRHSSLGRRDKARKDNRHLDYMLKLIRTREAEEKEALDQVAVMAKQFLSNAQDKAKYEINRDLLAKAMLEEVVNEVVPVLPQTKLDLNINNEVKIDISRLSKAMEAQEQIVEVPKFDTFEDNDPEWFDDLEPVTDNGLPWPPGLVGQIAGFVYYSSPRPVREIAITAALGVMAGICGKAWNIPGSGINMYIVLICQSAIGKEALHQGPAILERNIEALQPQISQMVDPTNYVSGPAIRKAALTLKSTCNFQSEFGRKLKRMADERDNNAAEMRTTMTELYQKSAADAKVGGVAHSNKDHNVDAARGISYSMVGESTPETFYDSLTDSMMEDGFLSRFSIVEYEGPRPPHNEYPNMMPSKELITCMCNMISDASTNNEGIGTAIKVGMSEDVMQMSRMFSQEMDDMVNDVANGGHGEKDQSKRQMYNRAHLKFLRLSALLSVGKFYGEGKTALDGTPKIEMREAKWALDFVRNDIVIMSAKLESGQVGISENSRHKRLKAVIASYMKGEYNLVTTDHKLKHCGAISYEFVSRHCRRSACFNRHRNGASKSIKETLYEFIDCGILAEVPKNEAIKEYNFAGKVYRVLKF